MSRHTNENIINIELAATKITGELTGEELSVHKQKTAFRKVVGKNELNTGINKQTNKDKNKQKTKN